MFDEHEPAEPELTPELAAIERQLARLTPAAPRVDRDRLMFEAGRASVSPTAGSSYPVHLPKLGTKFWPAATATMTAATVLLATMLVSQRQSPQLAEQPLLREIIASPAANQQAAAVAPPAARPEVNDAYLTSLPQTKTGYLGVRLIAVTSGIGAIDPLDVESIRPNSAHPELQPADPPTARDLMNQLLPKAAQKTHPQS
jgi:hypothetical protein